MKHKISKKLSKYAVVSFVILMATGLVTGGLISYYGKIETTATAVQPVTIDGKPSTETIKHTINPAVGGCCYCFKHILKNIGCQDIWVDWTTTGSPDLVGITVSFHQDCECSCSNPILVFPYKLKSGETLQVCLCYAFDPYILPGIYTISTTLVKAQAPI